MEWGFQIVIPLGLKGPQTPTHLLNTQNQNTQPFAQAIINPAAQFIQPSLPSLSQNLTIKLDQDNYLLWKNQLLNVIIANGFEEYIDGSHPCPSKFLDLQRQQINPEYTLWQRINRLIMSWLYSSLTESKVAQIVSCNTAFEIWGSLERTYASTSRSRIIELRTELQNIRKDGLSADEYIFKLKSIVDKLASIGEPVTHNDQIIYLLHGLGPEYNSFADTINARTDQPNIEEIHSLLLSCDMRHQRQNSVGQLNFPQPNLGNLNAQAHVANYQAYKKS